MLIFRPNILSHFTNTQEGAIKKRQTFQDKVPDTLWRTLLPFQKWPKGQSAWFHRVPYIWPSPSTFLEAMWLEKEIRSSMKVVSVNSEAKRKQLRKAFYAAIFPSTAEDLRPTAAHLGPLSRLSIEAQFSIFCFHSAFITHTHIRIIF